MKKLLFLLLPLPTLVFADPSHLGTGFYYGYSCWSGFCQPDPYLQSPQINVSIPYGDGNWGHATLPAGWLENGNGNADGWSAACNNPGAWNGQYYGTVDYNDGTIAYTGAAKFSLQFADTSQVSFLSGGAICCWQSQGGPYKQPLKYFIRKLKIQSCTSGHTLTNRFFAVGCDGYVESSWLNDPYCKYLNTNWINLTISGF